MKFRLVKKPGLQTLMSPIDRQRKGCSTSCHSRAISGSANPLQVCLVVAFVKSLTMFVTVSFEPGITYFNSLLRRGPFVSQGVWGEGKTSTTRILFFNYVYLHWNIQRQGKSPGYEADPASGSLRGTEKIRTSTSFQGFSLLPWERGWRALRQLKRRRSASFPVVLNYFECDVT